MKIAVIIPVFNGAKTIAPVLDCLKHQTLDQGLYECFVVNDGSYDNTELIVRQKMHDMGNLSIINNRINQGRSFSRNLGASSTDADYVLFLDADMLCEPDWLEKMHAHCSSDLYDVISGGRYHLNLGTDKDDQVDLLAGLIGEDKETMFFGDTNRTFEKIRSLAVLGMYPTPSLFMLETQMPQFCEKYPDSFLCSYSLITANVAIKRSTFEAAKGFDTGMRRFEDTELGIRLWEMNCRFSYCQDARGYHLFFTGQSDRGLASGEYFGFFYRHPYQTVLVFLLWSLVNDIDKTKLPAAWMKDLSSLEENSSRYYDFDVEKELLKYFPERFPVKCNVSFDNAVENYCEHSGIQEPQIKAFMEKALDKRIVAKNVGGQWFFDLIHLSNWLRFASTYQEFELDSCRHSWFFGKIYEKTADRSLSQEQSSAAFVKLSRRPKKTVIRGEYSIVISKSLHKGRTGQMNIPLPIGTGYQNNIVMESVSPENLLDYRDKDGHFIQNYPLTENPDKDISIRYSFTTQIEERRWDNSNSSNETPMLLAKYLRTDLSSIYIQKAKELLKRIFPAPVPKPEQIASHIYRWILENHLYFLSYSKEHTILDSFGGPCNQLAYLFVNFCRLMNIPARSLCGVLVDRPQQVDGKTVYSIHGRGFSVFSHTWAEFHTKEFGWVPVELSTCGINRSLQPGVNIASKEIYGKRMEEIAFLNDYNFGHIDPFHICSSPLVSRIPTYPLFGEDNEADFWDTSFTDVRHKLMCSFSEN